jgi:hypothetical protein
MGSIGNTVREALVGTKCGREYMALGNENLEQGDETEE